MAEQAISFVVYTSGEVAVPGTLRAGGLISVLGVDFLCFISIAARYLLLVSECSSYGSSKLRILNIYSVMP